MPLFNILYMISLWVMSTAVIIGRVGYENVEYTANVSSDIELKNTLINVDGISNTYLIKIGIPNINAQDIGKITDEFIYRRPWWTVEKEPYDWQQQNQSILILSRQKDKRELIMKKIAASEFPADCSKSMLITQLNNGFDSFGNFFFNYNMLNRINYWAVFIPYVIGNNVAFLDDGYCPDIQNRFECAFLPVTNCPMPDLFTRCKGQAGSCYPNSNSPFFTNASTIGSQMTHDQFHKANDIYKKKV